MTLATPLPVDPFDLPEELGTGEVTWTAVDGLRGYLVRGGLRPSPGAPGTWSEACDLLAVDEAYPRPVADDALRAATHLAWRHGQVHLAACDSRLTLLVPGTDFTAERVLEAVVRLAKALGASPAAYAVHLRLGG